MSLTTSVYEVVSLNDVPSEAKEEELGKKAEDLEDNKEVKEEKKENDNKDTSMSPVDGEAPETSGNLNAVHEEIAEAEDNDEVVEEIELIGDDKAALSDSIIIVEKDLEAKAEVSPDRRITRGFLNTSMEANDQEIELLKEDKSDKSNILEESDLNESEDDSTNMTPDSNKSDVEKSGNDENKSKLNDSFKVDLRPSWMMKKNIGERN